MSASGNVLYFNVYESNNYMWSEMTGGGGGGLGMVYHTCIESFCIFILINLLLITNLFVLF